MAISLRYIKGELKKKHEGEIAEDLVILIQNLLSNFLDKIGDEIMKEHNRINTLRGLHGLPIKRRIDKSSIGSIYISRRKSYKSEQGESNKDTCLQEADKEVI
jgi:hypothetical protein